MADGVIILSSPLWLEMGALPKSEIQISGRPVTLLCPRVPRDRGPSAKMELLEPLRNRRHLPVTTLRGEVDWGNFNETTNRLYVKALRFVAPMDPLSENGDGIFLRVWPLGWLRSGWSEWFGIFNDWLLAWRRYPREEPQAVDTTQIHAAAERAALGMTGYVSASVSITNHGSLKASTRSEVRAAIRCANQVRTLPVPSEMILRAHTALLLGRYRECLIDACTAAEAALTEAVKTAFSGPAIRSDALETVVKRAGGVRGLAELARDLGLIEIAMLTSVQKKLAEPRNRAVHYGATTDRETADNALATSFNLCEAVWPLATPTQVLKV